MRDALILDATRTPWGKFGGALKDYSAAELAGIVIRQLLDRNPQAAGAIDNVIIGQVLQGGAGQMPARQALVAGGLPFETPAMLVNKVCASGMRAVTLAGTLIGAGEHELVLAGGMESMSNAPYYDYFTRWGARMGDRKLVDGMVKDGLWCAFDDCHMANQGDDMAAQREISRLDMDEWSVVSQQRWGEAHANGYFEREITVVPNRRDPNHTALARDESPRPNSTAERLGRIAAVYGTRAITAGNAPGVNDGAAMLLVGSDTQARELGAEPLARIVGHAEVALKPGEFPVASAFAIKKLLAQTGLTVDEVDVIEVNEAFAAVPLICGQELGWDTTKVNRHGGSVAMGHPIGASGARLVLTTAYQLQELGGGYGIAAICSGSGQGDAILLKR
ncbi:MAG TPA: acetyl-CoA C-acyltransferase [Tepidiformaceae bacterium]|nr:acetyl-CoA C-acyltransferase [Tepidiformaceae bacterium]